MAGDISRRSDLVDNESMMNVLNRKVGQQMRYRFNAAAFNRMSRLEKVLYFCFLAALLAVLVFYYVYAFPKTLQRSIHSKPELDAVDAIVWYLAVPMAIVIGLFCVLSVAVRRRERRELDERVRGLDGKALAPDYFLDHRLELKRDDFTGVYVLHNVPKDAYYVGQGVRVYERLSQHFMGHGNADVYADWKYGDQFEIKVMPLVGSGYQSLNDLERDVISSYDAYEHGYNRTRGNAR